MELPIYQENLRSSGDWRSGLNQARAIWEQVQAQPDTIARLRALQMQLLGNEASNAARLISEWAARPEIKFSVPQLLELNRKLTTNETLFRETEVIPINEAHDPPLARMLPRLLDNAMGWFATEGFAEMNAVEQAALVHLRLLDLQPFAAANLTTAILAASYYTEHAGLPPLLFDPQDTRYVAAMESAFRMLTQHLVDYFAESLTKTISDLKS